MVLQTKMRTARLSRDDSVVVFNKDLFTEESKTSVNQAMKGLWGVVVSNASTVTCDCSITIHRGDALVYAEQLEEQAQLLCIPLLPKALSTRAAEPSKSILQITSVWRPPPAVISLQHDAEGRPIAPPGLVAVMREKHRSLGVSCSSAWGAYTPEAITNAEVKPFMTKSEDNANITLDFFDCPVRVTHYGFSSVHHILPGYFPRCWELRGSWDGVSWTVLRAHSDDKTITQNEDFGVWDVDESCASHERFGARVPAYFRFLRISLHGCTPSVNTTKQ